MFVGNPESLSVRFCALSVSFALTSIPMPMLDMNLTPFITMMTSPAPFEKFLVNDPGLIVLAGLSVEFFEDVTIDVGWKESSSTEQLIVEFVDENSYWQAAVLFGERLSDSNGIETTSPDFDQESSNPLVVSLNEDNFFVISGEGQSVPAVNLKSPSGGLIPGTSPKPFEFFVVNSPRQVIMGTWGSYVTTEGNVVLDVRWKSDVDIGDLVVEYGGANATVLAATLNIHCDHLDVADRDQILCWSPRETL